MADFQFPREYSFPPFFTRQTNLTTHHAQLTKWSALVLAYCQHHRIYKLSISPSSGAGAGASANAPGNASTLPLGSSPLAAPSTAVSPPDLFANPRINRRLATADIREVIDFMRRDGRAEYVYSSGGRDGGVSAGGTAAGGDVVWVYWRTPEEWAGLLERWIEETGQKGTVLTLYELAEGEKTLDTEFHGLDNDLLLKALNVLVKRGKAQIFGQDSSGVKFF
ncbi:Vacuolar protein-sorting-associated protein 25 [Ceratocystis fimbriata CBS 114723]|uniref:ESCRT-II complex subunit VPS25 n=1 Tax=Ceratocystis fimbriata CBS 114723 TaxID=1035309 RepID=A0A2C5X3W0_9PEZI|nr:Vacuolar protein-sorting-associated protein 25 [Ceratocystis fimbriata CBS 114723]